VTRAFAAIVLALAVGSSAIAAEAPAALPSGRVLTAIDPATGAAAPLAPSSGPMLLAFTATWCRPCLADLAKLADLEDRWKPEGFRLFLIAVATRQTPDRLRELAEKEPLPGTLLFDADGSVASAVGASDIPAYLLVDRRGRIVARSAVIDPAYKQAVERLVRQEGKAQP
jgi:cytochrome c biogenesis protein CcmG, thiol:disulfide interchange protein DsbE